MGSTHITQRPNQVCSSSVTAPPVLLLPLPSASSTHSISQEPDLLPMSVPVLKENSLVLLTASPRWPKPVSLTSTMVSESLLLVSLPTEPPTSVCSIPVKLSFSTTTESNISSSNGDSLKSLPSPLVLSLIHSIPSEEDS